MSSLAFAKLPGDPYAESRVHLKQVGRITAYEPFVLLRPRRASHGIRVGKSEICPPAKKRSRNVYQVAVEAMPISAGLSLEELEDRRWNLTKQSWDNKLSPAELLELRWIEAMLNAAEQYRMSRVAKQRRNLASQKKNLLSSIERLVAELRRPPEEP
jgi:hypothetical protein